MKSAPERGKVAGEMLYFVLPFLFADEYEFLKDDSRGIMDPRFLSVFTNIFNASDKFK